VIKKKRNDPIMRWTTEKKSDEGGRRAGKKIGKGAAKIVYGVLGNQRGTGKKKRVRRTLDCSQIQMQIAKGDRGKAEHSPELHQKKTGQRNRAKNA